MTMIDAGISQTGRILSMGRVTDLPDAYEEWVGGHRELIARWNELIRISKTAGAMENEACAGDILKELRQKAAAFLKAAEGQVGLEVQFVPELEAYLCPEETVPSIHFASLVMSELYKAAKMHVIAYIRQVDGVREPVSARRARSIVGQLREGLQMAAEYLEAEHRLMLPSALQLTKELESWYA